MLRLTKSPAFGAMAAIAAAAAAVGASGPLAGCSAEDVETPTYEAGLFPRVAHSGFNANARFRVMFATSAQDPRWAVADPEIATIEPSAPPAVPDLDARNLRFALVTTTKAGETTVTMTAGGTTLTSRLVVKAYTDEQLAIGRTRYEAADPDPARAPCASCHAKPGGVDHSPLKMAGFDDATILGVIREATYPESPTGQSTTSAYAPRGPLKFTGHRWKLTEPETDGILAHLRSLPLGGL
jgi:hypothetical protein